MGEIVAKSCHRDGLKLLEGLMPPQASLTWKLTPPNKVRGEAYWQGVARGKIPDNLWVMKWKALQEGT